MEGELPEAFRRIRGASTPQAVYDAAVAAVRRLLDADTGKFLRAETDRLVVEASSDDECSRQPYPIWHSLEGGSFRSGTVCVIDDLHDTRSARTHQPLPGAEVTAPRSLCCLPVGRHGVLVAEASRPAAFAESDSDVLERMAAVVETALDRAGVATPAARTDGGEADDIDDADILAEVADILSHDLKSPLNIVCGSVEMARETGDDKHFEQAISSLERIEQLIDETAFLARTGALVEQTELVDIEEAVRIAWNNVETGSSTLSIESSKPIVASRRSLFHLLEKLIENAVEYAGPGAQVVVGLTDDGFYVEDDGPGVPPAHRDQVFERGFSLERGQSGLGLSIGKRIAEAHGWEIRVEPASIGGARFEITGVAFSTG